MPRVIRQYSVNQELEQFFPESITASKNHHEDPHQVNICLIYQYYCADGVSLDPSTSTIKLSGCIPNPLP